MSGEEVNFLSADDIRALETRCREQVAREEIRVTQHAQQEMVAEGIELDEVVEAILSGQIIENYPEHRRGSCCLVTGYTRRGRSLHVVCTTGRPFLIVITVYEPKLPKWVTPAQRSPAS